MFIRYKYELELGPQDSRNRHKIKNVNLKVLPKYSFRLVDSWCSHLLCDRGTHWFGQLLASSLIDVQLCCWIQLLEKLMVLFRQTREPSLVPVSCLSVCDVQKDQIQWEMMRGWCELVLGTKDWNIRSALWSRSLCSRPLLHMAVLHIPHFSTVLLLTLVHLPAEAANCSRSTLQSLLVRESPETCILVSLQGLRDTLIQCIHCEDHTKKILLPYDFLRSPRKVARSIHKHVSNPEQQQTAPGLRSSS